MKRNIITALLLIFTVSFSQAQQFVENAVIEYEVKTNLKKTMGSSSWAEAMSESLPQFKTGYYKYSFANNKSLYKFDRWDEKLKLPEFWRKSDEESSWYFDHAQEKFSMKKNVVGSDFIVQDSIRHIEWKLSNENRIIAGYNCRKAVGKILDSVYVFAFYTDEIMISGGPCSISGLPGMILGLTIPRMYTSWIATKVTLNAANPAEIVPATGKNNLSVKAFQKDISERTKDWGNADDPESKKWMDQFLWSTML
jgi:GLPGLI family protein